MNLQHPAITVKKQVSVYEAELELDCSLLELNRFIQQLNESSIISDMSIQELPIEEMIKELYALEGKS
jgi:ABC-2 type transport system ATP-binding protein